jgi:hypothetical protein
MTRALCLFLIGVMLSMPLSSGSEARPVNRFVYAVVRHAGDWDPYGDIWPLLRAEFDRATSLRLWPERRVLTWSDPRLFESPFVVLTGRGEVVFSDDDLSRIREYLGSGGVLLIDNAEADPAGSFARSIARFPDRLYPQGVWETIPVDHAVYRSFFLLRESVGRRQGSGLKGLRVGGRVAVIYADNDLHGTWVPAPAGGYLFPCTPGGEEQRRHAHMLLMNIALYSVTGTYKTDAVHQEYLQRKLEAQ